MGSLVFVYHIWITASLPIKESKLISGLVNKGYTVSPAAANKELILFSATDTTYGVISCRIHRELASAQEVYDDVYHILTTNNFKYYSLVISEFSAASMWNAGNIVSEQLLPVIDKKPSKQNIN